MVITRVRLLMAMTEPRAVRTVSAEAGVTAENRLNRTNKTVTSESNFLDISNSFCSVLLSELSPILQKSYGQNGQILFFLREYDQQNRTSAYINFSLHFNPRRTCLSRRVAYLQPRVATIMNSITFPHRFFCGKRNFFAMHPIRHGKTIVLLYGDGKLPNLPVTF